MPRHVGDALDDTDRLDEGFDAVADAPGNVSVFGEIADAGERVAREQVDGGGRVLVEELHADTAVGAVGGLGPPRPAVVALIGRKGAVDVVGDTGHRVGVEPTAQVREARLRDEVHDVGVIVVGGERGRRSSGEPERSRKSMLPAVWARRPSISARNTTHQSRKSPRLRATSSVPAVM